MNIYVGNLPPSVSEEELREAFVAFGAVQSVNIIKDKFSGESKGFAFVEMEAKEQAEAAIQGLNDSDLKERCIIVNEARPKSDSRKNTRKPGGGWRR